MTWDEQRRLDVEERIRKTEVGTRGLDQNERHSPKWPCPLLEDGQCSVYAARPLICRGVNSLDAQVCEASLYDETARARYLAGELVIERYIEPLYAAHAISAGLHFGANELHGLSTEPLELTTALRILFDGADAVVARWFEGENAFLEARGGEFVRRDGVRDWSGRAET